MKRLPILVAALPTALLACARTPAPLVSGDATSVAEGYAAFDSRFAEEVRPILTTYCYSCHSGERPASGLDLGTFDGTAAIVEGFGTWELVHGRLERREMPPRGAPQPTDEERATVVAWISALRNYEAERNAGDPGLVLAHRLSNAQYDYTIHDLTGVEIRPTREFPIDPANEAGFDNSGETLALSPALLTKYMDAAREVAEHIVFKPRGFDFAPHVVVTDTDRDRYVVRRIIDFYERQPTDLADYFFALWRYGNREALGIPDATLADVAGQEGVSFRYLAMVAELVSDTADHFGPVAGLREGFRSLPEPGGPEDLAAVRSAVGQLRDYVTEYRKKLAPKFEVRRAPPLHIASQTLVMEVNWKGAAHRRLLDPGVLIPANQADPAAENYDPDLIVPSEPAERNRAVAALERFCDVFPDAFVVSERTSTWLARDQTGRLLSAGFHSAMGYFRDDGPLYDLILDDEGRAELDRLWRELDFIANAPERQLSGFVWFERTDSRFMLSDEFNHIRAEDQDLSSPEKFAELRALYMAKVVASGLDAEIQAVVARYFDELEAAIRRVEEEREGAEPYHLESLLEFAERAYRRPLTEAESDDLLAFYRELRFETGLSHEAAIRDALVSVLVSPSFSFRVDLANENAKTRIGSHTVAPLDDYSLASRLSYFLWSSMPDAELLEHAAKGDLHQPQVLRAQVRRMLSDPRVERLATEFGTNWLGVRRFEGFNAVDRERFPVFTNALRQAFFEEPIRFLSALIREDRPVTDLLFGDYTYVNRDLAAHYGLPVPDLEEGEWIRVDGVRETGRGGILPMAVFLTNTSPGLRTSPVKRGYWVARNVLGQHIPAPPPNVPQLPTDETELGELTLAETLARHRSDPACASCHQTFDFFGLAFEGFGPVGERRDRDLGGRPVEPTAEFPDGISRTGLTGVLEYLRKEREDDFVDNLCRRLVTYALGRGLMLSDSDLIREMKLALEREDQRFGSLVETIVLSPQFRMKRVSESTADPTSTFEAGK